MAAPSARAALVLGVLCVGVLSGFTASQSTSTPSPTSSSTPSGGCANATDCPGPMPCQTAAVCQGGECAYGTQADGVVCGAGVCQAGACLAASPLAPVVEAANGELLLTGKGIRFRYGDDSASEEVTVAGLMQSTAAEEARATAAEGVLQAAVYEARKETEKVNATLSAEVDALSAELLVETQDVAQQAAADTNTKLGVLENKLTQDLLNSVAAINLQLADHGNLHNISNATARGLANELGLLSQQLADTNRRLQADEGRLAALETSTQTRLAALRADVVRLDGRISSVNATAAATSTPACKPAAHASMHLAAGAKTTSVGWIEIPNSLVSFTTEEPLQYYLASMDFSAYGTAHGGIRLLLDGKIFGEQGTYGYDWVVPTTNQWAKRHIYRVLPVLTAGTHVVSTQIRSQANGQTLQLHGGSVNNIYSGYHLSLAPLGRRNLDWTSTHNSVGHDYYSTAWTNMNGQTTVALETTAPNTLVKVVIDFSVYGIQHGGMRLVQDQGTANEVIHGGHGTYGFDWIIAYPNNQWQKRTLVRVITIAQPGLHSFMLQIRGQSGSSRFYVASGSIGDYSGLHLYLFKLGTPPPSLTAAACQTTRRFCHFHAPSSFSMTGTTWRDYHTFRCNIQTTGRDVRMSLDFSVHAQAHGGVRIQDKTSGKVYGTDPTYGFDWLVPVFSYQWAKRSLYRVLSVPAGSHSFGIQFRAQAASGTFQVHGGTTSIAYSGVWLVLEEI